MQWGMVEIMRKLTFKAISAVTLSALICPAALAVEGDHSGYHYVRLAELIAKQQQEDAPYMAFFWQMYGMIAACVGACLVISLVIGYGPPLLKRCKNSVLKKMRSK